MARTKKEGLAAFNRKEIVTAAAGLFEQHGVEHTTMDDIAKEAGYSKSTLYVYFKSKEEIYNTIVYEAMLMLKQRMEKSLRSSSEFDAQYAAVCDTLVAFQEEYPLYFDSILGEISFDPTDFEAMPILRTIYEVGEEINDLIAAVLQSGINRGILRSDLDLLPTTFSLWGGLCGMIALAGKKAPYIEQRMKLDKRQFLQNGFQMLLRSLKK